MSIKLSIFSLLSVLFLTACINNQPTAEVDSSVSSKAWETYSDEKFEFQYPADWSLAVMPNEHWQPGQADYLIRLSDTYKKILFSAVMPDDYYLEGQDKLVNTDLYADQYILITATCYGGYLNFYDLNWSDFFQEFYPDTVLSYEPYFISELPELEAVIVSATAGLWTGKARVFIHSGNYVYDLELNFRQTDQAEAQNYFDSFVLGFNFHRQGVQP